MGCGVVVAPNGDVLVSNRGPLIRNYRVTRWRPGASEGTISAGGNGRGQELNQLDCPWGMVPTADGGVVVVDTGNHRVMHWGPDASEGTVVAGNNGRGSTLN